MISWSYTVVFVFLGGVNMWLIAICFVGGNPTIKATQCLFENQGLTWMWDPQQYIIYALDPHRCGAILSRHRSSMVDVGVWMRIVLRMCGFIIHVCTLRWLESLLLNMAIEIEFSHSKWWWSIRMLCCVCLLVGIYFIYIHSKYSSGNIPLYRLTYDHYLQMFKFETMM